MAKKKVTIGSVSKRSDGSHYIKLSQDIRLSAGEYLNLENEQVQLQSVDFALKNNWIDEAAAEKQKLQIVSFWNDPVKTKDGGSFIRKETIRYQVVMSKEL